VSAGRYNAHAEADRRLLAARLRSALEASGFQRSPDRDEAHGSEVWTRRVAGRPGYGVVVRTSIDPATGMVLGSGEGRIEVTGAHKTKTGDEEQEEPYGKAQPVKRTGTVGDIVERTLERARSIYRGVLDGTPHVHEPESREDRAAGRAHATAHPEHACTRCGGEGYRDDNPHWRVTADNHRKVCFRCTGSGVDPKYAHAA
jgi:hypothetical protein